MHHSSPKIALVTGANKGIGFEVARQLAASGCTVLLGARNKALGEEAAQKLKGEGLDVRYLALDLNDHSTIVAAPDTIAAEFGHLDILVNNAASAIPQTVFPRRPSLTQLSASSVPTSWALLP